MSSGPAYRVPFRRGSTPSFPPTDLPDDIPPLQEYVQEISTSNGTSKVRIDLRRRMSYEIRNGALLLNDDEDKKRKGKRKWSWRRILLGLGMLAAMSWIGHAVLEQPERAVLIERLKSTVNVLANAGKRDSDCRFVSPVEAYHRDLKRLRQLASELYDFDLVYPANLTHNQYTHHHQFSNTGHLLISEEPGSPHPIPLLLARGEQKWEQLLERQSQTLGEAVREYRRRYGRQPPKGFDIWWRTAQKTKIVLPDEYDQINMDLAPFFALSKREMKRRMQMAEDSKETFTAVIKRGIVGMQIKDAGGYKWDGTRPRAQDAQTLISSFAHNLPDMKATFSIFDQPQIYLPWSKRGALIAAGLEGGCQLRLIFKEHDSEIDWRHSCPPNSNLLNPEFRAEGRSLIYDPAEASNICKNPYIIPLHGLTIEPHKAESHPRPRTELLPIFSLAKTSLNSDILVAPLEQFFARNGHDPPWEEKRSSKLAWRGSPTGMSMMTKDLDWRNAHRIRLHNWANNKSMTATRFMIPDVGQVPVTFRKSVATNEDAETRRQVEAGISLGSKNERVSAKVATNFFMDAKIAGGAIQCSEADGTCDAIDTEIGWTAWQRSEVLNRHKFLLDIDGNGWSARFRRLMSTNSVVIKIGIFAEWFQPHLIPWFMYIPAKLDFSDLFDILAFFRGSPHHPRLGFDETAKALAQNGQCFVHRMYRMEDLQAYMFRLFLEYARLAADDDVDMDFYYEEVQGFTEDTGYFGDDELELRRRARLVR